MSRCESFGAADAFALMDPLRPYAACLAGACGGTHEPRLMRIFVLQRPVGLEHA